MSDEIVSTPKTSFYVAGGTLRPDAPSYVERPADREILERLAEGELCFVLTSRQMGKSSLMARTARRLRDDGTRTAVVDLTQIGGGEAVEESSWYLGVLRTIHRGLKVSTDLKAWWRENDEFSPVQRFVEYFREVALPSTEEPLVVFVDEIDSTLHLPFRDDFFAAIRSFFNARASEPEFERLSFVLLGVATPNQLIADRTRTPFNVGRGIVLEDFTHEESVVLARGLEGKGAVLDRVLDWTGGQPFLTQELCRRAAEDEIQDADGVDGLVEQRFLSEEAQREETHLKHIEERLTAGPPIEVRRRLEMYRHILRGRSVPDEPASTHCAALKLAGVVKVAGDGTLRPRNRLYRRIFDIPWCRQSMPADRARQTAYASLAAMLLVFLGWYSTVQPVPYIEQIQLADEDYGVARRAYEELRANPFTRGRAKGLMAEFWDRRALKAELGGDRDRALLLTLQGLILADDELRRREAGELSTSFGNFWATLRHGSWIRAVAFSPDGETVLTGSDDGTARLWRADSGAPIGEPMRHDSSSGLNLVFAVAFSPDGETVLTGSDDGTARLWRADSGAPIGEPMRHDSLVRGLAFSPDGETVLTGSSDGTSRLWRADSGDPIGEPMRHENSVFAVAFGPGGGTVLTGSDDRIARLWRADSGDPIGEPMRHSDWIFAAAFSPDGETVLTGSSYGMARMWRADSGAPIGEPMRHRSSVRGLAFSPDGETVLTGSSGGARLWRVDSGDPIGEPMRHRSSVVAVAFSPNGETVVTGSSDGTARLWRVDSEEPIGEPMRHPDRVRAVAFSPDGETVLTGSSDGARLWRADSGAPIGEPMRHGSSVLAVAFSPSGETVLTGSADNTARLWRVDSGAPICEPMRHPDRVRAVAFSPDGETVVTGSEDEARLWRADSGAPIGEPMLRDSSSPLNKFFTVAFSPDGETVVTGSDGGTARMWRADSGAPIGEPMHHEGRRLAVAFSPDGETMLTQTDEWLQVFSKTPEGLVHRSSRYLHSLAIQFPTDCKDCVQIAIRPSATQIRVETIPLFEPSASPIEGDPADLLEAWQQRLALRFDGNMDLEPPYSVPSPPSQR